MAFSSPIGDQEWLSNPCHKQHIRHGRSAAENQLSIFLQDMKVKFFKEIKDMYKFTRNENAPVDCPPKINKMLKPISNATNFTAAMHAFYDTLLQFGAYIDKLKDTPVTTKGEDITIRRKEVFVKTKEHLRLLICEYNDTLSRYDSKSTNHQDNQDRPKVQKINMNKCLQTPMDHSRARYVDFDFFRKLQKFLKQSRRILKSKKKKGGNKKSLNKNGKRKKKLKNQ